jgi:hypothetical protein
MGGAFPQFNVAAAAITPGASRYSIFAAHKSRAARLD